MKKDIRTIEDKGTVDCLQTIGVCNQSTVCCINVQAGTNKSSFNILGETSHPGDCCRYISDDVEV
ncbi:MULTISPECIES: hypothetical protein [unclassified Bacteroides]|uniref:hypothetical protein n=1 Tax=unclassified Bacteroides TaxID=2646097 RepID=UPI0011C1770A|nr:MULTISPECIES: hypothetical protein [unclassified Bacteroides]